jgi:arginyl-tRNA synthetase
MSDQFTSIDQYNKNLTEQIVATKQAIEHNRKLAGYTKKDAYLFTQLTTDIQSLIDIFLTDTYPEITPLPCLIHWIDKGMFGADFTIKFDTNIVRALGKAFASEFVPHVVELLEKNKTPLRLITVEQKGIYINCTLEDTFRANLGEQILTLGDGYGDLDLYQGQTAIAEYSSPNAAKHLHAGHVRSTVIGYVLSNIYEHAGYTVHRINHINDRGGFGQLIEGRKRWHEKLYAK